MCSTVSSFSTQIAKSIHPLRKGGTSVLADAWLVAADSINERQTAFGYVFGVALQVCDRGLPKMMIMLIITLVSVLSLFSSVIPMTDLTATVSG